MTCRILNKRMKDVQRSGDSKTLEEVFIRKLVVPSSEIRASPQ